MPSNNIVDLDELLGDDKQVRLNGVTYTLPPDLPVELYLRIMKFADTDAPESDQAQVLYDEILELFRYKQPKLDSLPLTMGQLALAIGKIYGQDPDGDGEAPRPPATRGGASSKTTRKRS